MSSTIPALPLSPVPPVPAPAKPVIKPPADVPPPKAAGTKTPEPKADNAAAPPPRPAEHHSSAEHRAASALSPRDIGYVDSLMGLAPAQAMEYIMLKTGVPQPANLGQDLDTSA